MQSAGIKKKNLYVLYKEKGYSSRIHSHPRPNRLPYCCQTKLSSSKSNLLEELSHLPEGVPFPYHFIIYNLLFARHWVYPSCFNPSIVPFSHRIKSKTLDVANEGLRASSGLSLPLQLQRISPSYPRFRTSTASSPPCIPHTANTPVIPPSACQDPLPP